MENIKTLFAKNLKKALKANGMTQRELAEELHIPPTTVNGWIKEKSFPLGQTLQEVAEVLNTTPATLVAEGTENFAISEGDKYLLAAIHSTPEMQQLVAFCLRLPQADIGKASLALANILLNDQ